MVVRRVLFCSLLILLSGGRAHSQDSPSVQRGVRVSNPRDAEASPTRRLIIVIGIDKYRNWPILNNAKNDAIGTLALFRDKLGFAQFDSPLLDQDATKKSILHLVDDQLRRELKPDDNLILFFAGHGTNRKDRVGSELVETGYLVPYEASAPGDDENWSEYIELRPFLASIGTLPARHILVILDSCYSGIALGSEMTKLGWQKIDEGPVENRLSRQVITSARRDQLAQDNGPLPKHSLFTGLLISGFESGKVDLLGNDVVTSTDLGMYLEIAIRRYPHAGQLPDFGSFLGDDRGEMILEHKAAGVEDAGSGPAETPAKPAPKPEVARSRMVPIRMHPLTGAPGLEREPKFSPDGSQIAFTWNHGDASYDDIYVKTVDRGVPLQLTHTINENYYNPLWSLDGRAIVFTHYSPHSAEIFSIPASGGRAIKIVEMAERTPLGKGELGTGMDLSHDGKYLVFPDKDVPDQPFGLFLLNTETHERRRLTSPIANDPSIGDLYPAFSPDDQKIAFIRSRGLGVEDVYVTSIEGGTAQRITNDNARLAGLTWMPDGQSILFASKRIGTFDLWRVAISDGALEDLGVSGDLVTNPAVSPNGNRLAFMEDVKNVNLWRVGIPETGIVQDNPIKLVSSAKIETGPQYSPDGKKIAYESSQSGDDEIWVCDSDGANATQLTSFRGPITGTPRWAPDSRTLVFDSRAAGTSDIYIMSIDETTPHRLTEGKGDSHVPSWSVDGQWIFFASNRTGRNEIWKLPVKEGPAVQATRQGGFGPLPSPDGKFIYYAKGSTLGGLWRAPVDGRAEELVLDQLCKGCWGLWAISDRGIYFAADPASNHPVIQFFDLDTKKTSVVFAPAKRLPIGYPGLALSPNGKFLLFSQVDLDQGNIMLMDISH